MEMFRLGFLFFLCCAIVGIINERTTNLNLFWSEYKRPIKIEVSQITLSFGFVCMGHQYRLYKSIAFVVRAFLFV